MYARYFILVMIFTNTFSINTPRTKNEEYVEQPCMFDMEMDEISKQPSCSPTKEQLEENLGEIILPALVVPVLRKQAKGFSLE